MTLVSTGVTDIGMKSADCCGTETFGTGVILARFHYRGTIDLASDWVNKLEGGLANSGAPRLRNHAGIWSSPMAVGFN